MKAYAPIDEPIINDDIFSYLIKKETNLKNVFPNAIYIKNSIGSLHWSYYIYFYSRKLNTCYINDLNFYWSSDRLSVTNTIELLSTKLLPHIKAQQQKKDKKLKIPKFIYFHTKWYWSKAVVRQKINLQPLYNKYKVLLWFGSPDWSAWNDVIVPDINDMR